MHGHIAHFAINADDLPATRAFYEGLFGWEFAEYTPGFLRSTARAARSPRSSSAATCSTRPRTRRR